MSRPIITPVPEITPVKPTKPVITPVPITVPGVPGEKIHFVLSARDLPRRERGVVGTTTQDPYVKWSTKDKHSKDLTEVAKTKHRINERNPDWLDSVFSFDWMQGQGQLWHFEVMDFDVLNADDHMGFVDIDVDKYVLEKNEELSVKLSGGGTLLIKKCTPLRFRLSATDLPKLDPFNGLSDPYVQCFWSFGKDGPPTLFHKTETIKNVENAEWDEVIEFPNYQTGTNQFWTFKVFDKDPLPKDDAIGQVTVFVDMWAKARGVEFCKLSEDPENKARLVITPA